MNKGKQRQIRVIRYDAVMKIIILEYRFYYMNTVTIEKAY